MPSQVLETDVCESPASGVRPTACGSAYACGKCENTEARESPARRRPSIELRPSARPAGVRSSDC
eukprot:2533419-Alexandrium_andersonii.AAC.1